MNRNDFSPLHLPRPVLFGVPVATILVTGFTVQVGIGLIYAEP